MYRMNFSRAHYARAKLGIYMKKVSLHCSMTFSNETASR